MKISTILLIVRFLRALKKDELRGVIPDVVKALDGTTEEKVELGILLGDTLAAIFK